MIRHIKTQQARRLLFVLLALTITSSAKNVFVHPTFYPAGATPLIVALGDFNGDGKMDALVRNGKTSGPEALGVALGDGNGGFAKFVQSPPLGFLTWGSVVGDVDGDGVLDVITLDTVSSPMQVHVLHGVGDGTFRDARQYAVGNNSFVLIPILLADLNGDGHLDIVVRNYQVTTFRSEILALMNKGDGTFLSPVETVVSGAAGTFVTADFNRDGKADVAWSIGSFLDILLSLGNGSFQSPIVTQIAASDPLAAADFDGDGIPDLATQQFSDLLLAHGNGDGTFQPAKPYSLGIYANGPFRVADFNGDGAPDIFQDAFGLNSILLLNRGNGLGFLPPVSYRTGILRSTAAVVGDVNGDGLADLVADAPVQRSIGVLLNRGKNLFNAAAAYSTGKGTPSGMAIGDFNNDGRLDAIVGADDATEIILSRRDGRYSPPVDLNMGRSPFSMVAADFNQDQKLDLVAATQSDVEILLGNGDGTFGPKIKINSSTFADQVLAGDFNGDHKQDVAITTGTDVLVLLGKGDGTFQPAVSYPISSNADWIVAADFNGDGKTDFVVAGISSLVEMLGNGDGTFQSPSTIATGVLIQISAMVTADLNNDGKADLAMIGFDEPTNVAVFLGNGDGTFRAKQTTALNADGSASLVVADFNQDGKLDLVVGSNGYKTEFNSLRLVLGNGDGTFQPEQLMPYSRQLRYWSLAVSDFNQDGWPDLIFADTWSQVAFVANAAGK